MGRKFIKRRNEKMNKEVQMVKFNGRKQHIIADNFAMISNIFAVPPHGDV